MKKFLLFNFAFLSLMVSAQNYSLVNQETGDAINDGDTVTVNTSGVTTHVIFTNNSSVPQKATLEIVNIINTDGTEMSFCFGFNGGGNCYFQMNSGGTYDSNANNTNYLQPGQSTGNADIDFTHTDANPNFSNYPKDYVLKLTVYNANDDSVLGVTNFTYRYDPNAQGINTFDKNDVFITTGYHVVNVISKYATKVSFYNLTGQKVKEVHLKPKQNHIYTGNMTSGIYIVHVLADNGKELFKKLIIK